MMDIVFLVSYHIHAPLPLPLPLIFLFFHSLFRSSGLPLYMCTYSYSSFFFAVEIQVYTF